MCLLKLQKAHKYGDMILGSSRSLRFVATVPAFYTANDFLHEDVLSAPRVLAAKYIVVQPFSDPDETQVQCGLSLTYGCTRPIIHFVCQMVYPSDIKVTVISLLWCEVKGTFCGVDLRWPLNAWIR